MFYLPIPFLISLIFSIFVTGLVDCSPSVTLSDTSLEELISTEAERSQETFEILDHYFFLSRGSLLTPRHLPICLLEALSKSAVTAKAAIPGKDCNRSPPSMLSPVSVV